MSQKLTDVIARELDLDELQLTDSTTADAVPGWDSLNHAQIIAAVEEAFGVRFGTLEILSLRNVGELQQLIDSKR